MCLAGGAGWGLLSLAGGAGWGGGGFRLIVMNNVV